MNQVQNGNSLGTASLEMVFGKGAANSA